MRYSVPQSVKSVSLTLRDGRSFRLHSHDDVLTAPNADVANALEKQGYKAAPEATTKEDKK